MSYQVGFYGPGIKPLNINLPDHAGLSVRLDLQYFKRPACK